MHTIYVAQYSQKPVLRPVHIHQSLTVIEGRLPKILITEYLPNALTKILQAIAGTRLTDVEVFVEHIGRTSVCELLDCGSALLFGRVAGFTGRILPHAETFV